MANNYGYTSYGAQGGADGGGFMGGGSQAGSQDTPNGKTYGKDTLRPVTIKQIIDAEQPHPDSAFKIDSEEVTSLTFVGQVNQVSEQATNTTLKIDDGTGLIEVKQWVDSDLDPEHKKPIPHEGQYVRVWGRLKAFNNKRHVATHQIRVVTDYNEVGYHFLEATVVHLYFARGPLGSVVKTEGGANGGMFVPGQGAGAAPKKEGINASAMGQKVFRLLQSEPQNNEGLNVSLIASKLGVPQNEVFKAGDELLSSGLIYTTVDDETWAVLEY